MKSLCIVIAFFGQFQVEELPKVNQPSVQPAIFVQEELPSVKKSTVVEKPHFELLGAVWCGGCQDVKARVKMLGSNLPFTYSHRDVDASGWLGAGSIPAWAYKGKVIQYGWSNPEGLMQNYRRMFAKSAPVKTMRRLSPSELRAFAHSYKGRSIGVDGGDFWSHLQELPNHNFVASQLNGLTQAECERIHSAHHDGFITPFTKE